MNRRIFFYYVPGGIATIKHSCVALVYVSNSIQQLSKPQRYSYQTLLNIP
ncbi:MAG TPA: hypothetical protein VHZ50_16680 [Puia sp.]|nr:hypothetical protein [Puia sp.]